MPGSIVTESGVPVSEVRAFDATELPPIPRFQALNSDVLCFDSLRIETLGGVFLDNQGAVAAIWASYSYCENRQNLEEFLGLPVHGALLPPPRPPPPHL